MLTAAIEIAAIWLVLSIVVLSFMHGATSKPTPRPTSEERDS